ncbi:phage tail tape measure protein [Myxacorys almedinensis]|uniref:Uncharacterized protein n=1 Tax=Myxacorys almedinensis A TaxID=2690445 RepID=A0A8J8CMZ0_9CYAN|nr:phage tail tape measure protein [Myxacorys almedinensis]NDJ17867.1 hypothetical protein [Myxacorys almedinensis A]
MDELLKRSQALKLALTDFVYDAEGELATALESFVADHLAKSQAKDRKHRDLAVDTFLGQGHVGDQTPLQCFVESEAGLSERDRTLVLGWSRNFAGLFLIQQVLPDGFKVMNWLTTKTYIAKPIDEATLDTMMKLTPGEILLTRLAALDDEQWIFFSPYVQLGKLGKPKLAVAIGNFKQNYRSELYGDAPELLEEAWKSVERYHQDFLDFFETEELTLPGYQLSKKIPEFQDFLTQRRLDEAGVDRDKSMAELAQEAGVSDEEIAEMAEAMGMDAETAAKMMTDKAAAKMVTPQIELPPDLKKAEQVTILAHPRWGQMLLPNHNQFIDLLQAENWTAIAGADKLLRNYLERPEINTFVWKRLAKDYPTQLQAVLREFLQQPDFDLAQDLPDLLRSHQKPLEPELPEIASVPLHLHNLFQEALAEVSKSKAKEKKKSVKGFQR